MRTLLERSPWCERPGRVARSGGGERVSWRHLMANYFAGIKAYQIIATSYDQTASSHAANWTPRGNPHPSSYQTPILGKLRRE